MNIPVGLERMGERLGAPTLITVLVLLVLVPKIDHGISVADHVDAIMQTIAASCDVRPRVTIQVGP